MRERERKKKQSRHINYKFYFYFFVIFIRMSGVRMEYNEKAYHIGWGFEKLKNALTVVCKSFYLQKEFKKS